MSQQKHVLYLSDQYLAISDVKKTGLDVRFSISLEDPELEKKVNDYLTSDDFSEFSVFIDAMGSEIKQEHLPHVTGKDRALLLDRKVKSLFPAADLVWKDFVKREKTGRKDDVFLFIGISLSPAVKHVLELLEASKQIVKGIYSMTALQQELTKGLPSFPQMLIISRVLEINNQKKTFRQSFFQDGDLVISRVNKVSGAYQDSTEYDQLFDEVERTYKFLQGGHQMKSGATLKVVSLLSEKETKLLIDHKLHYDIDFSYASFDDLAKNLGMKLLKPCVSLPEVLGNLAMSKGLTPHFKPAELCETYHVDQTKKWLKYGSVLILCLSLIVSGWFWFDAKQIENRLDNIEENIAGQQKKKDELAKSITKTDVKPAAMKQTVELFDVIQARSHKPTRVLNIVSRAYDGFNDLDIRKIAWVGRGEDLIEGAESKEFFVEKLNGPQNILIVVRPDRSLNTRDVLQRVNDFSASLLSQPEVKEVKQDKSAIDIRSSAQLAETFGQQDSEIDKAAEFTLVITL